MILAACNVTVIINQFPDVKIHLKTIDLSARRRGPNTEFVGFIPQRFVLKSVLLG